MNLLSVLSVVIGLVCSALGFIVITKEKFKEYSFYFFLACQFTTVWIFANVALPILEDLNLALLAARISFTSGVLIITFLFLFALGFPQNLKKSSLRYLTFIPTLFFVLVSWTDLITVKVVRNEENINNIVYGSLYIFYTIYLVILILSTIFVLQRKQRELENQERLQARYFLTGIILSSVFILTTNLLIPTIFRTSYFSRFGPVFMIFFLSITFFAIVRHRLFGINFIIGKSLTVVMTAIIAYLTFYIVLGFDNFVFGSPYTTAAYTFGVLIAIGFTFLFIYLNKSFDEYIGKHITYSEYDPEEIRRLYLQTSSKELNLEKLIQFTFDTFRKYFDTGEQEIYITDKETKGIPFHYNSNHKEKLVDGEKIYSLAGLKNGFETLLISVGDLKANSEEKHKELIEYMDYFDFQFVTELEISTQYSGYIFIGSKISNEAYTHEEVNLMQDIIFTFAASISRALLHLATEKFNDLLSRKVEEQTKEITEQNKQLKDAYEAERDRMNILSHELRTPLGTTRNAVSIIKMLFEGKKMDTLNPKVIECLSLLVKGNEAVVSIQDLFNKDLLSKDNPLASQSVNLLAASMKAVEVLMELYKNNEFITPNQSVEKNLDIALENLRREVVLLERIFTVSQIRAGTLNIMSTKVSCNEVIDKAVESFAHLAEKKGVQIEVIKPSEDIVIQSDGVRVKEIVANLFENAAKYTNEGKVVIGYEDIGNKVRFFVKDTGIGIPKEEIPKIGQEEYYKVDKYLQSSSNDKLPLTRPDGTGLGMYVIRHLATLLKGELIIESELGKGSQFYVTLPQ